MAALQQAALPEIKRMMELNPLSTYAAWQPREIAGTNPFYEQLFGATSRMGPAAQGLETIFGAPPAPTSGAPSSSGGGGMTFMGSDVGSSSGAPTGGVPAPPPNFQPLDLQAVVQNQVQAALAPAVQQAVDRASPPRNSIQGTVFYDQFGNPHPFDSINGLTGMPGYSLGPNANNTGWQVMDPAGSMVATS